MLENIYLFTYSSNIGELAYVGCHENTWETMHDKDGKFWDEWKYENNEILSEGSFGKL